ncbi:gamma-glutamyl-gamma-aminobutyrate hydrolase family protein [Microbacterium sediminis]|nr:gamma-glutamyl-gamma-aminobutyrate hydrolase family protein [Microbacterium sediminis]
MPVIGITTYRERAKQGVWDVRAAFLPEQYMDRVSEAGGAVVLLPPQPDPASAAARVVRGLDGLVLTGGLDVQPELYGAPRHALTDPARADRDDWELALLAAAREAGIPVLGICRGLQLINVAFGGTLVQHLPDQPGGERYRIGGGVFAQLTTQVLAGTRLAAILGPGAFGVHAYHHQGLDRLGEGLVASARMDDGLVYAAEAAEGSWLVAVQWHPEENAADIRLFEALIAQADAFAKEHA